MVYSQAKTSHDIYHAQLLDVLDDAVIAVDRHFVVTSWNRAAERLYGWTAAEARGCDVADVVRLDMSVAERAEMRRRTLAEGRYRRDVTAFRRDGSSLDVEVVNVPVRDPNGELEGFLTVHRDIAERKRFEREQERLAQISRASSDFIGMADLRGRMLFVNEAGRRLVGLHGADAVARTSVLDYVMPRARSAVRDHILPMVRREGRWSGERVADVPIELRHFEGRHAIPVFCDVFRLDDPATGSPFGFGAVIRDRRERWRAEALASESRQQIETILESITDGFYAMDRDWRLTYVNERAMQVFSEVRGEAVAREDVLGNSLWDLWPVAAATPTYGHYHDAVLRQEPAAFEYRGQTVDRVFEVRAYPSEEGLAIYFRDITDARRAEEERLDGARQQALVADLGLRALATDDLHAVMDDAAATVARTLGVDLVAIAEVRGGGEDLILRAGVGWREGEVGRATAPRSRDSLVGYTLIAGSPVVSEDVRSDDRFGVSPLVARHGIVSALCTVIAGRDEPFGILGAFTTHRRSLSPADVSAVQAVANVLATAVERAKLAETVNEVREAERQRIARDLHDEALQDLSHATALAAQVEAVSGAQTPDMLAQLRPVLVRVGKQLRGAIYDLRLGLEGHLAFVDLLEGLIDVHRAMAPDSEIALECQDVPAYPLGAVGAEVLRILGEALTNVRRHAGAGDVRVRVWSADGWLGATVSDDGRGFEPGGARSPERTGIRGMRERADALGGHVDVRSEPGSGTAIRLEVPMSRDGDALARTRILLVEDHATVREAIASALHRETGFEIVGQAASLADARAMLENVDVALVDLGLPDGYGGELIRELRQVNPRAQAIVLSASLDRRDVARAVDSGAAGVLQKTAHLDEVVDAIRRLRAGETLLALDDVLELLRFAGRERARDHDGLQAIAQLTPRECEVLQALADGLDSRQIADRLHISIRTERNHMSNILAKLGVHSQLQALLFALRYDAVTVSRGAAPDAS